MALVLAGCSSGPSAALAPIKVEIVRTENGFQLMRDGNPYTIKGAGMAIDDIENFAAHGGNSIRNWTTAGDYQDVQGLLDAAYANGVTVALCLPMKPERAGFDYSDADAVAAQIELFRQDVIKYRDHPALLFWIIGNELNHSYTNPSVYDAVNVMATMIHSLDPNHPTTTTVSEVDKELLKEIGTRAPALDFVSFQVYGKLFGLRDAIAEIGFDEPFMVTEWGAIGYWEMEQTSWGAPVEMTSSEKASVFLRGQQQVLDTLGGQLIGSYVFLWGQKQERTPTWFGMFTETGEATETVDVMRYIWNGSWPANRSPRVNSVLLAGRNARQNVILSPGERYAATADLLDHEDDPLRFRWEVKRESDATVVGGDYEESIESLAGVVSDSTAASTRIIAPAPGQYRLFVYVYDDHGHAAHANIPFLVRGADQQ